MRLVLSVHALAAAISLYAQPTMDWQRLYGGALQDNCHSMDRTLDGGYITLSVTRSTDGLVTGFHGGEGVDLWVVKLTAEGDLQWQRCLGGSDWESEGSIRTCADGGYILIGSTRSEDGDLNSTGLGLSDIWVIKLTPVGEIAWQRRFGGSHSDTGHRIEQLPSGGFVLMGMSQSNDGHIIGNHGQGDYWIAWLDTEGELENARCFGGTSFELLVGDLVVLSNGTIAATGATYSNDGDVSGNHLSSFLSTDTWVFSTNSVGDLLWQRCLGGSHSETGETIQLAPDGTILVASMSGSTDGDLSTFFGEVDTWLVRLSANGVLLDEVSLGGSAGELPWDIQVAGNGNIYVLSQTRSTDGQITEAFGVHDSWLCKLNPDFDLLWQKSYGGSMSDFGCELVLHPDGNLCVAGSTASTDNGITGNHGSSDLWVVKFQPEDVGVSEIQEREQISITPNPGTTEATVHWKKIVPQRIEVVDELGKVCIVQASPSKECGSVVVPIEQLARGIHVVRLVGRTSSVSARFVKH